MFIGVKETKAPAIKVMCKLLDMLQGTQNGKNEAIVRQMNSLATYMLRYGSEHVVRTPTWVRG